MPIKTFDEIQEDIVFLMLKEGLPKGFEVIGAHINEKEKWGPKESRKDIVMRYRNIETQKAWTQSYNYNKVLRTIDKGLAIEADRT